MTELSVVLAKLHGAERLPGGITESPSHFGCLEAELDDLRAEQHRIKRVA